MQYQYKITTISNRKGDIVELQDDERTRHLLNNGIITPVEAPKVVKPTRKGGRKPQDKKAETK